MANSRAGWYPDAHQSDLVRWWDGDQWTARTAPNAGLAPAPPPRPPLGDSWFRLSLATQLMLGMCVLSAVASIVAYQQVRGVGRQLAERPRHVDLADAELTDTLITITAFGPLVLYLLTGVLFIAWLYQAHRSDRMDPTALRHGSGWAIGGWFVPILNWWRPYQVVTDVRTAATGPGAPGERLQLIWWIAWLVSLAADRVGAAFWPGAEELTAREYGETLETAATLSTYTSVIDVVAAVLAILLVRRVTAVVRDSAHGARD